MPEEFRANDPGDLWRSQPEEKSAVMLQTFVNRRTRELSSSTRSEIVVSISAALFFIVVMTLTFRSTFDRLQQAGLLITIAWILVTIYRFRARLFTAQNPGTDSAATGLEYYRRELEQRRDHLKSAWLWHGPLLLAVGLLLLTAVGHAWPSAQRLRNMLPFIILLCLWIGISLRRRSLVVKSLESEIRELGHLSDAS